MWLLLGVAICLDLVALVALVMPFLLGGRGYMERVYLDGKVEHYLTGEEHPASWFVSRLTIPASRDPASWGLGGFLIAGAAFFLYGTALDGAKLALWAASVLCLMLSISLIPFALRNRRPQSDLEAHFRAGTCPDGVIEDEGG
jgi:hypothetical protein